MEEIEAAERRNADLRKPRVRTPPDPPADRTIENRLCLWEQTTLAGITSYVHIPDAGERSVAGRK